MPAQLQVAAFLMTSLLHLRSIRQHHLKVLVVGDALGFTYTVPASFNINRLSVVAFVVKYSTGDVLNSGKSDLKFVTGIENEVANASLFLYPNPASQTAYLDLKITKPETVSIQMVNLLGQTVYAENLGTINGNQMIPMSVSNLPSGIYQLKVSVGDQVMTKKLDVIK